MRLIKCSRSILILISLALIFTLGVMASIAQEKEIRDFLKSKVPTTGEQATAGTLKFKFYSYVTQDESLPAGDVEGHMLSLTTRRAFCILENGEIASEVAVQLRDLVKGSGSSIQYRTMTFADGSTIMVKAQTTVEGTAAGISKARTTREIIKGTGRFQGIKGTGTSAAKYLPLEKGELGPKGIGEGTLTYTLPSK